MMCSAPSWRAHSLSRVASSFTSKLMPTPFWKRSKLFVLVALACCACRASAPTPNDEHTSRSAAKTEASALDGSDAHTAEDAVELVPVVASLTREIQVRFDATFEAEENRLATPTTWQHGEGLTATATRAENGDVAVLLGPNRAHGAVLAGESYVFVFRADPNSPTVEVTGGRFTDHNSGKGPPPIEIVGGKLVMSRAIDKSELHVDVRFNLRSKTARPDITLPFDGQFSVDVPAIR